MIGLKKVLFDHYGGFGDKRIKNLSRDENFIIDDRTPGDHGANKDLYPYFCTVLAKVIGYGEDQIEIALGGNVPLEPPAKKWAIENNATIYDDGFSWRKRLTFTIPVSDISKVRELAYIIASINQPFKYKKMRSRTAKSLRELINVVETFLQQSQQEEA